MNRGYVQYIVLFVFTTAVCMLYNNCTGQRIYAAKGNSSGSEIIYEQSTFDKIEGQVLEQSDDPFLDTTKLSLTQMGQGVLTQTPQWNVGDYTGLVVPSLERSRFEKAALSDRPSTAAQLYGTEAGMLIYPSNSVTLTSKRQPMLISQDWQDTDNIHPWSDADKALIFSAEVQIPKLSLKNGALARLTMVMKFKDAASGAHFTVSTVLFDSRRNYFGEQIKIDQESDEAPGYGVVMTLFRANARYNNTILGNFGSDTWAGYKRFAFAMNQENVQNILTDLKKQLAAGEMQDDFSPNPGDYVLVHFAVNPEINYPDFQLPLNEREKSDVYMGSSVRNIKIYKTFYPKKPVGDCSNTYQGMGVFWCEGNTQHQRFCGCQPQGYDDSALWNIESNNCFSHTTGDSCQTNTPDCSEGWETKGVFWCDGKVQYQRVCGCRPLGYNTSGWTNLSGDCYVRPTGVSCEVQ